MLFKINNVIIIIIQLFYDLEIAIYEEKRIKLIKKTLICTTRNKFSINIKIC